MKAIRVHQYGGPDRLELEDVTLPEPGPGEALVQVRAAGVGPWDALVRTGHSGLPQTLPLVPGSDIAGTVVRVEGQPGGAFKAGDAVYGVTNPSFTGGYAEYAVAKLESIAPKPERLGFVEAAGVPVVAVTAWTMLFERANVRAGQTILILGAAGNVGAYAVQLARWAKADVAAVAGSRDEAFVRDLGAGIVIDYKSQRFEDLVRDVDVVIDTVGGEAQARAFAVLRRGGSLISAVSPPSEELAERQGIRATFFIVEVTTERLGRITKLIDEGVLKTDLGTVLDLADARKAHEMLAGTLAHPRGKIVLDVPLEPPSTSRLS